MMIDQPKKSDRYSQLFSSLEQNKQIAWIPFIMLGYPNIALSLTYIETLIENGADALEIGIPFSDPVADGILIQETARVALENGATVSGCLEALGSIRQKYPSIPIGLLTYANLVYHPGIEKFYANCAAVGIDSVLIADLPLLEAEPFIEAATKANIDAVFIAPPNATEQTLQQLGKINAGYTYVVSRPGVTGDNKGVEYPEKVIASLLENAAPPPVLGFGISKPEHVKKAQSFGFKGVISGSAISRIILKANHPIENTALGNAPQQSKSIDDSFVLEQLKIFSLSMKKATEYA